MEYPMKQVVSTEFASGRGQLIAAATCILLSIVVARYSVVGFTVLLLATIGLFFWHSHAVQMEKKRRMEEELAKEREERQ